MEAELRRRVRTELTQARVEANGELTDAALANAIARAIGAALGWHLESPEHTRNATLSSRTWRPARWRLRLWATSIGAAEAQRWRWLRAAQAEPTQLVQGAFRFWREPILDAIQALFEVADIRGF